MKRTFLITALALLFSSPSFSLTIPKKLMGQYLAEIPAFDFEDNGRTVHASGYLLSLFLKEDFLIYKSGILEFQGEYKSVRESGSLVDIDVEISNDISVDFNLDLIIDKKTGSIQVKGLIGVPQVKLQKREIVITKKNKGFKRL